MNVLGKSVGPTEMFFLDLSHCSRLIHWCFLDRGVRDYLFRQDFDTTDWGNKWSKARWLFALLCEVKITHKMENCNLTKTARSKVPSMSMLSPPCFHAASFSVWKRDTNKQRLAWRESKKGRNTYHTEFETTTRDIFHLNKKQPAIKVKDKGRMRLLSALTGCFLLCVTHTYTLQIMQTIWS